MKIHFWGATDEVTGSMTFIDLPEGKILVDCGLTQGLPEVEKLNLLPLPFKPSEISAVIITHAHLDHTGYLPRLVKKGFKGAIHCTPPTAKLMRIILIDSAKLSEGELYDEEDVQQTLRLVQTHEWSKEFKVAGAVATFTPVGHILGASSTLISIENKRLIFSGDLGRSFAPILPSYPSCPHADVVVMESTYGGKIRQGNMTKELEEFLMTISRESRVGIIASFAVARAQTLLTLIHNFHSHHPEYKVRVVMDSPMMKEANKIYQQYSHLTLQSEALFRALDEIDAIEFQNEWDSLRKKEGPLIIVSSSGMLTGGRINRHLYNWHDDEKAILFLPGYQGEGTPGRAILEGKRELTGPKGELFRWNGQVWGSTAFSSHADHNELQDWVSTTDKSAHIFLIHGEENSKTALKKQLKENGFINVAIATRGQSYEY